MTTTGAALPFVGIGSVELGPLPIHGFGVIAVIAIVVAARVVDRYAARWDLDASRAAGLAFWVTAAGMIGAHVFDDLVYERAKLAADPLRILKMWTGISSFGGFIGGSIAWVIYVRRHRLEPARWADAAMTGLLPGFTIGRLGCTLTHDHKGRATEFFGGIDYPGGERLHNLGFYEFLYLIPVCVVVLRLAFGRRDLPAGFVAMLAVVLYTPVRFGLELLRRTDSDPRYAGLTFAQWASIVAFGVAAWGAARLWRRGRPAHPDQEC